MRQLFSATGGTQQYRTQTGTNVSSPSFIIMGRGFLQNFRLMAKPHSHGLPLWGFCSKATGSFDSLPRRGRFTTIAVPTGRGSTVAISCNEEPFELAGSRAVHRSQAALDRSDTVTHPQKHRRSAYIGTWSPQTSHPSRVTLLSGRHPVGGFFQRCWWRSMQRLEHKAQLMRLPQAHVLP